ncbi:hypothetical protein ACWEQG_23395 [Microbispora sp. NPDC004025]
MPTGGNSSSSRDRISADSPVRSAVSGRSSCPGERGPMTGAVTPGRDSSQARRAVTAGCGTGPCRPSRRLRYRRTGLGEQLAGESPAP